MFRRSHPPAEPAEPRGEGAASPTEAAEPRGEPAGDGAERKAKEYRSVLECLHGTRAPPGVMLPLLTIVAMALGLLATQHGWTQRGARGAAPGLLGLGSLDSRNAVVAGERCPRIMRSCKARLQECRRTGERCGAVLRQCQKALAVCKGFDELRTELPAGWVDPGKPIAAEEWDVRFEGWGKGEQAKRPWLRCGKHGKLEDTGKVCRCAVLYGGPDCDLGYKFTFRLPSAWDAKLGKKRGMRDMDMTFDGDIVLNRQSSLRTYSAPELGKAPEFPKGGGGGAGAAARNRTAVEVTAVGYQEHALRDDGTVQKTNRFVGLADEALWRAVPEVDWFGGKVHDRCAIVGNSGNLLYHRHGVLINSYDAVFRFNDARTRGPAGKPFKEYVGTKTTYRIVSEKFRDFQEGDELVIHDLRAKNVLKGRKKKPFLVLTPEFTEYLEESIMEYDYSVGWIGVMLGLQVCRRVDMFGMAVRETHHNVPHRYFDTCGHPRTANEQEYHDDREWVVLQTLAQAGIIHFGSPCVKECRIGGNICQACRARSPYTDVVIPDKLLKVREKNGQSRHCRGAFGGHASGFDRAGHGPEGTGDTYGT